MDRKRNLESNGYCWAYPLTYFIVLLLIVLNKNTQREAFAMPIVHVQHSLLFVANNFETLETLNKLIPVALPEVHFAFASLASTALSYLDSLAMEGALPQLILLDLYLSDQADGKDLLRQLKQTDSPYQSIPVVVMSSVELMDDIIEVTQLGAEAYLVKPQKKDEWVKHLQALQGYWYA
jgi:CheY-like chemotaxis protein